MNSDKTVEVPDKYNNFINLMKTFINYKNEYKKSSDEGGLTKQKQL